MGTLHYGLNQVLSTYVDSLVHQHFLIHVWAHERSGAQWSGAEWSAAERSGASRQVSEGILSPNASIWTLWTNKSYFLELLEGAQVQP